MPVSHKIDCLFVRETFFKQSGSDLLTHGDLGDKENIFLGFISTWPSLKNQSDLLFHKWVSAILMQIALF